MKKTLLALALTASLPALAITAGTEVTEEQMKDIDYTVNVRSSLGDNCTGLLVANQYVITAAHCIDGDKPDDELLSVNDDKDKVVDTTKHTMTAYIGSPNRDNGKAIEAEWVRWHPAYRGDGQDYYSQTLNEIVANDPNTHYEEGHLHGDLAILKLKEKYLQDNSLPLQNTELWKAPNSDDALTTIRGWGHTETKNSPLVMSQAQMSYDKSFNINSRDGETAYLNYDMMKFLTLDGGHTAPGDSGGPMIVEGKAVAFVSLGGETYTKGTGAFQHLAWFSEYIDDVNTIGKAEIIIDPSTNETKSWDIPVQPLKLDGDYFMTELIDETGLWSLDGSNCDGIVEMGEICNVQITFNAKADTISQTTESELKLNGETSIKLLVSNPPVEPDPVDPNEPWPPQPIDEDDGGSSGGSFGYGLLLGLLALGRRR